MNPHDAISTPAKLLILAFSFLYRVFQHFSLEVSCGLLLSGTGAFLMWGLTQNSRRSRLAARVLLVLGMFLTGFFSLSPLLLFEEPSLPRLANNVAWQAPPNHFKPLLRNEVDFSQKDGFFREALPPHRILLLRGVNFGSKTPQEFPETASIKDDAQFYTTKVSFVDRPCRLQEAPQHFARIRSWGFTILRLIITWEGIEHEGPGLYDDKYVEYIQRLCQHAGRAGLSVIIDPHQDVWSRFTGGDGAPAWTLEKVGFNLSVLHEANAAVVHHQALHREGVYPRMVWPTNYGKLACATMFTLFFAGNEFAPRTRIDNMPVQEYLQSHYLKAIQYVANRLREEANVLGFDSMNEPSMGFVGLESLHRPMFPVPLGFHTSAFQGMTLGAGFPSRVNFFSPIPFVFNRSSVVNAQGRSVWKKGARDVWRENGVWEVDASGQPTLLRSGHFKLAAGHTFMDKHFAPFLIRFQEMIRNQSVDYAVFAEPALSLLSQKQEIDSVPHMATTTTTTARLAWAPHFYDGGSLLTKSWSPWFALDTVHATLALGSSAANHVFSRAGELLLKSGSGFPVLIGETGMPMDLNFGSPFYGLNRLLSGLEESFLSWTLWNYMPWNSPQGGDGWNGEDLSLFNGQNPRQALMAAIRPYPLKLAGQPVLTKFDPNTGRYVLKLRLPTRGVNTSLETILFLPTLHYPRSVQWQVGGRGSSLIVRVNATEQLAVWKHEVSPGATSVEPSEEFVDQWIEIYPNKNALEIALV